MSKLYAASRCFEIVSEESAEMGDVEERGFIYQDTVFTLEELIDAMRDFKGGELSDSNNSPESMSTHCWVSTYAEQDFSTGNYRTESFHINKSDLDSGKELYAIYVLAGIL